MRALGTLRRANKFRVRIRQLDERHADRERATQFQGRFQTAASLSVICVSTKAHLKAS